MAAEVAAKMADVDISGDKADKESIFKSRLAERLPYYQKRVELFETYLAREKAKVEAATSAAEPIKVIMPDGAERSGIKGVTSPFDVAKEISSSLAKKCVVAKVKFGPLRPPSNPLAPSHITY
eukprot:scaffold54252_cov35-Prasinocladus_malaysianus.AAC.2